MRSAESCTFLCCLVKTGTFNPIDSCEFKHLALEGKHGRSWEHFGANLTAFDMKIVFLILPNFHFLAKKLGLYPDGQV